MKRRYTSGTIVIEPVEEIEGGIQTEVNFELALVSLVEKLHAYLSRGDVNETYVVITGGYKGFIPWVSLLTFLYDSTYLVYLHEQSQEPLITSSLFLQWDVTKLDEMRTVIRRERITQKEYDALPAPYRLIYDRSNMDYELNALGRIIHNFFKQDPLWRYGYGRPLLQKLKQKAQTLYEILLKCLPRWEHLWIGDQIPETVEHSQRHSMRLMEYAYWLLTYFPELEENLGAEGLFYLISSLWLHDIGHGALFYQDTPVGLMPSMVREYHHLSSAQMIEEGDYLPQEFRKPVALLARFNRQKLPLVGDGSLESKAQELFPDKVEILTLAGGLLGLLDGLDVQMDRVVNKAYKQAREERNRYEIEFYLNRLKQLETGQSSTPGHGHTFHGRLQNLYEAYKQNKDLEQHQTFEEQWKQIAKEAEDHFKVALTNTDGARMQIAMFADRIAFKLGQRYHFDKHSSIALVYLSKGEGETLKVSLRPGEDMEAFNRHAVEIARDILKEVERAQKVPAIGQQIRQVKVYGVFQQSDGQEREEEIRVNGT